MPRIARPFFRQSDGWWYVNLTVNGKRRQVRLARGREARRAAEERYHSLMASRRSGGNPGGRVLGDTAHSLLDRFLLHSRHVNSPLTADWYAGFLNDFAAWISPDIPASALRTVDVTEWMRSHADWSPSTRAAAVCCVRRAFRWAVEQGILASYPFPGLRAPAKGRRETVLTDRDFDRVLRACGPGRFRELLQFLWLTGCRPQEASKLEIRHVDLAFGRCVFPAQEAKGARAPRVIWLTAEASALLREIIGDRIAGPVFRNSRGRAWTKDSVKCAFSRLKSKIGSQLCAYVLRHSFATRALERGVDPITVSVLMGHSDPSTVARVYQHLSQRAEHMARSVEQVNQQRSSSGDAEGAGPEAVR